MFNILRKKDKESISNSKSYSESINEDIVPMYLMMAIVDKAEDIGIESWDLQKILQKSRKKHTDQINMQIDAIINKIENIVHDNKFKNSLKSKIIFIADFGDFIINDNSLEGTYQDEKISYSFKMDITGKGVTFTTRHNSLEKSGNYAITNNSIIINYVDKEVRTYDIGLEFSHNIDEKKVTRLFDKDGFEIFNRIIAKKDNYKENKNTHAITINEPDTMENYTETEYKWRTNDNHILTRTIKKYLYPDGTKAFINLKNADYCCLRSEKINAMDKEIPFGGHYYGFDKDLFFAYKHGDIEIDEVKKNVYSKHCSIPHIEYI